MDDINHIILNEFVEQLRAKGVTCERLWNEITRTAHISIYKRSPMSTARGTRLKTVGWVIVDDDMISVIPITTDSALSSGRDLAEYRKKADKTTVSIFDPNAIETVYVAINRDILTCQA